MSDVRGSGRIRTALRAIWCRTARTYQWLGGSGAVINACVTIIAACCALFAYWAFWERIVALESEQIVRVEPFDRIIDRDVGDELMITRRFCMRDHSLAYVRREFVGGIVYQTPGAPPVQFQRGCHERPRPVEIPSSLPPGDYIYRVVVEFCNRLRCESIWLHDVPIVIKGGFPVEASQPPPPLREPL